MSNVIGLVTFNSTFQKQFSKYMFMTSKYHEHVKYQYGFNIVWNHTLTRAHVKYQ